MEPDDKPSTGLHNGNGNWDDGREMEGPANVILADDEMMIGEAYESGTRGDESRDLPAEANARLWAAAPELLAALEDLTTLLSVDDGDVSSITLHRAEIRSFVLAARAAIAKAKGES